MRRKDSDQNPEPIGKHKNNLITVPAAVTGPGLLTLRRNLPVKSIKRKFEKHFSQISPAILATETPPGHHLQSVSI